MYTKYQPYAYHANSKYFKKTNKKHVQKKFPASAYYAVIEGPICSYVQTSKHLLLNLPTRGAPFSASFSWVIVSNKLVTSQ